MWGVNTSAEFLQFADSESIAAMQVVRTCMNIL